jgi:YD repeat-containing protein
MGLAVGRHVVFPFGQALPAARDLWALAAALEAHQVQRGVAAAHARKDWSGRAHDHFEQIVGTEEADTAAVADSLRARARLIAGLWAQAYGQENRVLRAEDEPQDRQRRLLGERGGVVRRRGRLRRPAARPGRARPAGLSQDPGRSRLPPRRCVTVTVIVSARPANLKTFVDDTRAASTTAQGDIARLRASWDAFAAADNEFGPADTGLLADGPEGVLGQHLDRWHRQEDYVDLVHRSFVAADEHGACRAHGPEGWEQIVDHRDGVVRSVTDADGVTLEIESDDAGCPTAVTDGMGRTTTFAAHPSDEVAAVTRPDGATWVVDRDDAGRPTVVTAADGHRTEIRWTPGGRLHEIVGPAGARTRYRHGPHGEVDAVTDPRGRTVELAHDRLERLVGLASGEHRWALDHSPLGPVATVRDPGGHAWRFDHDAEGRTTALTDPLGHRHVYDHDAVGDLVRQVDAAGGITCHLRDDAGRVVAVVDPEGGTTRVTHDRLGRVVRVESPDGGVVERRYQVRAFGCLFTGVSVYISGVARRGDGWSSQTWGESQQ